MALDHTELRGVTHYNKDNISKQLKYGILEFLQWGFLNIGAFSSVRLANSGVYGGSRSTLRPVKDKNFTDGQVWEGFRSNWIWETGTAFGTSPINISGAYVNNTFHPLVAGSSYIDYKNGRYIFSSAISTTATVKAEFSYRTVNFVDAEEMWFRRLMYNSYHNEKSDYLNTASGIWNNHAQNRAQMPIVGIELVNRLASQGYELGSPTKERRQDVIFHVFSENPDDKDQIADILERQDDKTIWIPNKNLIKVNDDFPIDYRGMTVTSPKTFPQMVSPTGDGGYQWRTVQFSNTHIQNNQEYSSNLFSSTVRTTLKLLV